MPADPPAADPERPLFDEALDFPAGSARDAWLAGACCGVEALRSRILALLPAHEQETHFLPAVTTLPSEKPVEHIGRYKLLERVGEGGFGVVYTHSQKSSAEILH